MEEEEEVEQDDGSDLANDAELSEADSNESLGLLSDEDDEDDDGVEEAYAARAVATRLKALAEGGKSKSKGEESEEESEFESDGDDDQELDIDNLMHESLLPKALYKEVPATAKDIKKMKETEKKARAKNEESPEERDARTIFIGNVPVGCSTSVVRFSLSLIIEQSSDSSSET